MNYSDTSTNKIIKRQIIWKISFLISFQFSSVTQSCLTLSDPMYTARQVPLSVNNSRSIPKLMSVELVMPSNHLTLCHPLLLPLLIFPRIRVFSNESVLRIRWPKYWSFSFSISPSNEYSELISFRMDWLDLLTVQGTHRVFSNTTVQKHLRYSAFLIVQLSHPYMTTEKTTALTRWTFVDKVMFLLFNMLFRFVAAFLPRSKCLHFSLLTYLCLYT